MIRTINIHKLNSYWGHKPSWLTDWGTTLSSYHTAIQDIPFRVDWGSKAYTCIKVEGGK